MLITQFFGHQYFSISLLNLHWYAVFVDGGNSSSFSSYLHLVSLGVASLLLFLFFCSPSLDSADRVSFHPSAASQKESSLTVHLL